MNLLILTFGALISFAVCGCMILAGVGDIPDDRSSHAKTTPTSGGLGIIAAMGFLILILTGTGQLSAQFSQVLALVWAAGLLGLMDDLYQLSAKLKFLALILIAFAVVWVIGPVTQIPLGTTALDLPIWAGWAGSALWVFAVMNIVNFMDGSNGLMLVVMGIGSAALAGIAVAAGAYQASLLLLILLAGMVGVLPFNLKAKAGIFSGDVGSLTIGLTYAIAALWFCQEVKSANPIYIGPVLIMAFLVDGLLTLLRRALRKENLMDAHRSHLYQRLMKGGMGHVSVAAVYGLITLIMVSFTFWAVTSGLHGMINYLFLPTLILTAIYVILGRKFS